MFFVQVFQHVLPFVPLATLNHRLLRKDALDPFIKTLDPVNNEQDFILSVQAPVGETVQKISAHLLVLRTGLDEPQYDLLALRGDPQGDDDLVVRKISCRQSKWPGCHGRSNHAPGTP